MQSEIEQKENRRKRDDRKECRTGNCLWHYQQIAGKRANRSGICRKVKCREIFSDQRADEPKVSCTYQLGTGKDADHQFLCRDRTQRDKKEAQGMVSADEKVYLVDLPGYGYAKVSQNEKQKWGKMIEDYLHKSSQLKAVFLLIDIRHDPSANDKQMYDWVLHNGFSPIIIATKLDKIKRSQVQKQVKAIKQGLQVEKGTLVIPFSAETKQGREEIWSVIEGFLDAE